jgi:integrase
MAVKNPIFKILRCPDCNKQNWHTEPITPAPPCTRCGGSASYSPDWYIKVIVDGKRHIQAIGRQKQHAESALKKAEAEIFFDTYQISQESPLLSEAITTLYNDRWKKKKAGESMRRRACLVVGTIGDIPLNAIGKKHMHKMSDILAERGTADSTANRYRAVLRSILRFYKLPHDFINMDPEIEGRIRIISDTEEQQILDIFTRSKPDSARIWWREMPDLYICLLDTGARLSEILNLPPGDIDLKNNMITIWLNKADKPRSIPMTARVRAIMKTRKDKSRLFEINMVQADYVWARMREELELEHDKHFVIHALRHTCITRLLQAGVDIYRVMKWAGHKNIKTTLRYIHLAPHDLNDALSLLENRKTSTDRQQAV